MELDMKLRNAVWALAALSLLAGCSSIAAKKKAEYKTGTVQAQPLEVPPDLTTPEFEQRYAIPAENGGMVASYSEYTKQKTEQPCVTPVTAQPAAAPLPSAKLQDSNGSKQIVLNEPFDRSWRRVGLALEHARIAVGDKDRSKGVYYVAAAPSKDKKADKAKLPDYLVTVREDHDSSAVSVTDHNGKSDAESARLIEVLYQNLNADNASAGNPPPAGNGATPPGDAVRPAR